MVAVTVCAGAENVTNLFLIAEDSAKKIKEEKVTEISYYECERGEAVGR
jgi:hypothetical protein